jgi:membrane-associated phospholipid phosphatase
LQGEEFISPRSKDLDQSKVIPPLAWAILAIFIAADFAWLALSSLHFAPSNFWLVGQSTLIFGGIFFLPKVVSYRLSADNSRISNFIRITSGKVTRFLAALFFTLGFGFAGCTFTYLSASLSRALLDARLAQLDESIGFNWLALLELANSNSWVSALLVAAYHSAAPQLIGLYLLLAFTDRVERMAEFLSLFAITFLVVAVIYALVPAAGAFAYYQPAQHLFNNFSPDAGMWHYEALQALRSNSGATLDLSKVQGLVTFPSFHTSLAIITAYAVRDVRFFAIPVAVLNGIVIVATLPEGGHYLVDVVAGAVIAALCIAFVRRKYSGRIFGHRPYASV